jgi:hypothetical protein
VPFGDAVGNHRFSSTRAARLFLLTIMVRIVPMSALTSMAVAQRHGHSIGFDAFCKAVQNFDPAPDSFDEYGNLTVNGAFVFAALMHDAIDEFAITGRLLAVNLTKDEIDQVRLWVYEDSDDHFAVDRDASEPKTSTTSRKASKGS